MRLTMFETLVTDMTTCRRRKIMQTIQASEFEARCIALMDDMARSGEV